MSLFDKLVIYTLPLIPKPIVKIISKPYVAGSTLDQAINKVKTFNQMGMAATLDVLGESAKTASEYEYAVEEYFKVLEKIDQHHLQCNISVKLTQLGLLINPEICFNNIYKIVEKAKEYNNFVRIDMEDSDCTTHTLDIFYKLRKSFSNVGIVIQSYLRRSLKDVENLAEIQSNLRICKGIYIEPRRIAYKDPVIVNEQFTFLVQKAFEKKCHVGIATHDEKLIWNGIRLVNQYKLARDQYEFQMLLGVDEELRDIIVKAGHKLRVYIPYGKYWYSYCVRRLKENPQIARYVIRALFYKLFKL